MSYLMRQSVKEPHLAFRLPRMTLMDKIRINAYMDEAMDEIGGIGF